MKSSSTHGTVDPDNVRHPRAAWRDDPSLLDAFNRGTARARAGSGVPSRQERYCLGCAAAKAERCRDHEGDE